MIDQVEHRGGSDRGAYHPGRAGPVRSRRRFSWVREVPRFVLLTLASISAIYPVWFVASVALKTQAQYVQNPLGIPTEPTLANFVTVLTSQTMWGYISNSILVIVVAVPLVTALSVTAGYALARLWGRGGLVILMLFLFSELVPLAIVVIPLLLTIRELGVDNGILRLIAVYTVSLMGFGILVSRAFFLSVPEELREAARLDGCSEFRVFTRVMIPLARSPITLIAVVALIAVWNEYFLAVVLLDSVGDWTLPVGLTEFRATYSTNFPALASALILSAVPTAFLYAVFQNRIVRQFSRGTAA